MLSMYSCGLVQYKWYVCPTLGTKLYLLLYTSSVSLARATRRLYSEFISSSFCVKKLPALAPRSDLNKAVSGNTIAGALALLP